MRILVTGAYGFIGSQVTSTLLAAGHEVICCVRDVKQAKRRFPNLTAIECNFIKDQGVIQWLPRLTNIDVVVNCVGVLQTHKAETMQAIHDIVPRALVKACLQSSVKKFVHISALGADEGVDTLYAKTKHSFELYLLSLDYNWVVLRPSLIYGPGSYGGTSLFRALASLPWVVPIVGSGKQLFQPIHIRELAKTIQIVIDRSDITHKSINVVGPETISVESLFLLLRQWLGFGKAKIVHIPLKFIRIISYLGNWFKDIPINSTSYKMLTYNNIADVKPFIETVGFKPSSLVHNFELEPSSTQDRWHARLYFLNPLLRISLGLLWLSSGLIPLLSISHAESYQLLAKAGMTETLAIFGLYGSILLDSCLGLATLANWRLNWIGSIQIAVILFYTTIISFAMPEYWLDPLGALTKNIPLIIATLMMMAMSDPR